ncbi:hypothetical protein SVIOM342S_03912 [Streptomyces violaceorubidus]
MQQPSAGEEQEKDDGGGGGDKDGGGGGGSPSKKPAKPAAKPVVPAQNILLRNTTSHMCAELPGREKGVADGPVQQAVCDDTDGDNQIWDLEVKYEKGGPGGAPLFQIRNIKDRFCMDLPNHGSAAVGTPPSPSSTATAPPRPTTSQLRELALRARHRDRVLGDWRLSAGGGRGRASSACSRASPAPARRCRPRWSPPTWASTCTWSSCRRSSTSTSARPRRTWSASSPRPTARTPCSFDEADAVFGKRSEVKDAHDEYANMESAYLLQRLESFDGIALLTTNLRANIDEAFTRRLDLVVDFPFPDVEQRLALWRHSLSRVPSSDGIDPGVLARDFELAGGSIRSAVVTAAYLAAGRDDMVAADDLLEGARREYRKAGRLVPGEGGW